MGKLVDIIHFLHVEIQDAFGPYGMPSPHSLKHQITNRLPLIFVLFLFLFFGQMELYSQMSLQRAIQH
jgi:hypothetical protein